MSYYHCPRLLPLGGLSLQPRASRIDFAQFFAARTQEPSFIHQKLKDRITPHVTNNVKQACGMGKAGKTKDLVQDQLCARAVCERVVCESVACVHEIVRDDVVCVKELCVCVCVYSNVPCQELCVIMVCEKTCVCVAQV